MKHSIYLTMAAIVLLAGCTRPFKKADNGIEYKIISDEKGKKIENGNFFEIQIEQQYKGTNKDTIIFSSKENVNQIIGLDSASMPPIYYKIFSQVRKGDSIVLKQSTDSLMKQAPGQTPPFMKKGGFVYGYFKIVNIFETRLSADSAFKVLMTIAKARDSIKAIDQLKKDDKTIKDYLSKNNITAVKAPQGTYVQIITPGEGDVADTSKVVKVYYTGKSIEEGKVFDSNKDPKFGHTQVLPVHMIAEPGARTGVIKGWLDGLSLLRKGSKANFYIPSSLAYGTHGAGGEIKPNSNLMFEIEVVDVISKAQAAVELQEEQTKMQEEQKRMMDSAQKARKAVGGK